MLPGHCKDVAVKEVPFALTAENIAKNIEGQRAYTRCEYYVLRHQEETAVVHITKAAGPELFRPILTHEIVSLPATTLYLRDPEVDVINMPAMAEISQQYPQQTVVVEGRFGHVSFTRPNSFVKLHVLDVVPPSPAKLSSLVKTALASGLIELPLVVEYEEIDINQLAAKASSRAVLFPCRASGLQSDKEDYYLDQLPEVPADCTLIGCDLSERIYREIYGREIARIEMCPRKLAAPDGAKRLVKCCKIRNGHHLEGNLAMVPWGTTIGEIVEAINDLFADYARDSSL